MKALDPSDRTQNLRRQPGHCGVCGDQGMCVVQTRVETHNGRSATVDEYGPCPFCAKGLAEEFPDASKHKKSPGVEPPWHLDGFWQGRDLPDHLIQQRIDSDKRTPPMSQREQLAAIQTLAASLGLRSMDNDEPPLEPERPGPNEAYDWESLGLTAHPSGVAAGPQATTKGAA